MSREELLSRITVDPNVCFGKPCIRGHRIWASLILDLMASEMRPAEILEEYPGLEEADILACIAYGAEMARERYFDVATAPTRGRRNGEHFSASDRSLSSAFATPREGPMTSNWCERCS